MQECVNGLWTFHHDHVTAIIQDLQEGYQEDLTESKNGSIWKLIFMIHAGTVTKLSWFIVTKCFSVY